MRPAQQAECRWLADPGIVEALVKAEEAVTRSYGEKLAAGTRYGH